MVTRATLQLHHGECMSSFNCHDSSMIIHHDHDHFYHVNINMNIHMIYKYILRVTNPTSSKHVFEHIFIYIFRVRIGIPLYSPIRRQFTNTQMNNRYHYHILIINEISI